MQLLLWYSCWINNARLWIFLSLLETRKLIKAGEHFIEPANNIKEEDGDLPNEYLSLVPLITVVLVLYILVKKLVWL